MTAPLVSCDDVFVLLGGRAVLENVCLEVRPREILALVGPNGGGKTTLIRTLAGLQAPTGGSIAWSRDGTPEPRPNLSIAYVPQRATADFRYPVTVRDVVGMPLLGGGRLKSRLNADDRRRVDAALERMRIGALASRPIARLSGGQQQRTLIARALALQPKLILLDEPTTGIDAPGQEEMIELLMSLRDRDGAGIVFSTHHPGDAVAAVDRGFCVDRRVIPVPVAELDREHYWHGSGAGHERHGGHE